ncbi:MAG TPA: polysaccharide deacetylase family protein, partial [Acidobacteriota bacterium]
MESRIDIASSNLLKLLRQFDVRATFFVLGVVAEEHPDLIRTIYSDGHEIGVHGYSHRFVRQLTPAQFREELDRTLQALRRALGTQIDIAGHRAPYFSMPASEDWPYQTLAEAGFRYDSSIFPIRGLLYGEAA